MAHKDVKKGGYNVDFVNPLDSKYKCAICSLALRSPFQTECGHRFCENCIKPTIISGPKICPVDKSPLSLGQIFKDAFCNREILEMECFCTNKALGCKWTGQLRKMKEEHYGECEFVELDCLNDQCKVKIQRGLMPKHLAEECLFKKTPCPYCGREVPHKLMEKHHNEECPKIKLPCPKGCPATVAREEMEHHIQQTCPNAESSCPFLFGACEYQGSRIELRKHLQDKSVDHAFMIKDQTVFFQSRFEQLQTEVTALAQRIQQLERQLSNQNEVVASLRDDSATLRSKFDGHEKKMSEMTHEARAISPVGRKDRGAQKPIDTTELNEVKRGLKKVEDQVTKLQVRERQALGRGQMTAQTPAAGQGGGGEASAAMERRVAAIEHQQTLSDVQMADHDVKISMLETTSYDGMYIWKIDELGRRIHEAVTAKTLSIYSPPFYVGRFGYKVCARVYLNGDGMGKGTHLSLFFVVMRGASDALLPWPFQQKVSFELIDQSGDQHIIDSFRPDPNSSSFQRPTSNMNIASGCPLFVPKSVLHSGGYIKDESIFFKISVEHGYTPFLNAFVIRSC